jgi:hypothetical protein
MLLLPRRDAHPHTPMVPVSRLQVLFGMYTVATAVWALLLHKTHDSTRSIKLLGLTLGTLKALALLCEAERCQRVASTGLPGGWDTARRVSCALILLNVVALVAAGWVHVRPVLGDRHRKLLATAIPCLLSANIAIAVAGHVIESTPAAPVADHLRALRPVARVVDVVALCVLLAPVKRHLPQYFVIALTYITFSRVAVFLICSAVSLQYICLAASEAPTLALYAWAAVACWPREPSPEAARCEESSEAVQCKLDAPLLPCTPEPQAHLALPVPAAQ